MPVVKEVMKAYKGRIDVVEIDTDELPDVAENAQVSRIYITTLFFSFQYQPDTGHRLNR